MTSALFFIIGLMLVLLSVATIKEAFPGFIVFASGFIVIVGSYFVKEDE